jgi:hypothetical protein
MQTRNYRMVVIGCAFSWLMLGMHASVIHEITHHHRMPRTDLLLVVLALGAFGVASLWMLLRREPARPPTAG